MLRETESIVLDSVAQRNWQGGIVSAQGDVAMAEGRAAAAAAAYRRAEIGGDGLPEGCPFCTPALIGIAYDRANMSDSAIVYLERYLSIPTTGRVGFDRWFMAPAHKRLGELYEAKGDNAKAVSHYTAFVNLWQHADPDMQPKVAEARTFVGSERREFDVIFLDPPFGDDPWAWLLSACAARLAMDGFLYAEAAHALAPPSGLVEWRRDKAGRVHYHLFTRGDAAPG
jgi:hypothetical protein